MRRSDRRQLPNALAAALPFEPRERVLSWAICRSGCRLVATAHGLWEWPLDDPARNGPVPNDPVRRCWRTISDVRGAADTLTVHSESQQPVCHHRFAPGSELPDLVRALVAGSRLVDLSFTLPSGSRLRVQARTCRFEGTLVWSSQLHPRADADDSTDREIARGLMARARQEYGTVHG